MIKVLKSLTVFILKVPVHGYRILISPLIKPNCRYQPTCSAYMVEALDKHGPVKGLYLGLKRLMSCHPLSKKHPYDPVPLSNRKASSSEITKAD